MKLFGSKRAQVDIHTSPPEIKNTRFAYSHTRPSVKKLSEPIMQYILAAPVEAPRRVTPAGQSIESFGDKLEVF